MENLLKRLDAVAIVPQVQDLFSGSWKNQLKSVMHLQVQGGHVVGTYITAVGDPDEKESELIGFVLGDLITFTVNFGKSLAAWSGQIQTAAGQVDELVTMWHLIVDVPDEQEEKVMWKDTYAGSDRFTRLEAQ
jgi:hypothetical protein